MKLLRVTLPLPNCMHITEGNPMPEKWKKTATLSTPPPTHRTFAAPSVIPIHQVIISFHGPSPPDGQIISTIDGGVREPVLLCYSCPVR